MNPEEKENVRNQLKNIMARLDMYDERFDHDESTDIINDAIVGIENLLIDLEEEE